MRGDLRVTGIALSALEGAVELGAEVIDSALQQRRISVERLEEAYRRRFRCVGAAEMGPWSSCWSRVHGRPRNDAQ
ncbi:hypothetical protein [Gordonia rubripertincta]|uniref:hypothetical protein n=1 Tax=Gordonia rubripertincta TaxID=36822 RepID=UPI0015FB8AE5|nr:hypothetical protein [Gordonia rubripertincta]QMU22747.1 hypothetical protein H3V45_09865 [Gordonia rubripertincta]